MRIVEVKFLNSIDEREARSYFYKDKLSTALKQFDTVVVPTANGITLAVVTGLHKDTDTLLKNYGVSTLKEVHEKIKSKTVNEILKEAKAIELKRQLEEQIKKMDAVEKYRVYAENNPEVAALLAQLEELNA